MGYLSLEFMLSLGIIMIVYYLVPKKIQWELLAIYSFVFYFFLVEGNLRLIIAELLSVFVAWGTALIISKYRNKYIFFGAIVLCTLPLLLKKYLTWGGKSENSILFPIGLSFYTLQIISYIVDVYKDKIKAEKNLCKAYLYFSFFPIIIQGPISRYGQLAPQLFQKHKFEYKRMIKAIYLIMWAFFLKYMIADKAGIFVDQVFDNYLAYKGCFVIIAGIFYSIQLYTDFLSCVTVSIGVGELFGIELFNNFDHPYFAISVKDFWKRWHRSLSLWLRDYIYIPLGGSRRGKFRKIINLFITFVISGIWHGEGFHYIVWGLMHACYQLFDSLGFDIRTRLDKYMNLKKDSLTWKTWYRIETFVLVTIAWIMFRADSTKIGLKMIWSIVATWNPWVIFDGSLYRLGLDMKDWNVLIYSIVILVIAEIMQRKYNIREWLFNQNILIRAGIVISLIVTIVVFGTYGIGYDANTFIYGGF